jgi:ComF family protein
LRRDGASRPDLIVPVPLSPARLAERGYNQAWELARRLARSTGVPARADVLQRVLDTPHQADLNRAQRLLNPRGAFTVPTRRRAAVAGLRIALVDDVLTTGATAREAAQALLRAGAAAVDVWVVARTPES